MADQEPKKEHHHSEAVSAADLDHHGDIEGEEGEVLSLSAGRKETEMDMTPMVDVTFLLLIFFMVTAAFSLQKSLPVPTPKPDEPSSKAIPKDEQDPSTVTVIVDSLNTYRVITPDWEAEAPSEQEMLIKIREARETSAGGVPPNKLLVKAHVDAFHEKVVTALDAGTEVGMESVQLMTIEDDDI